MPKMNLKTDLLAPRHFKAYEFAGYHPTRFLKIAPNLIKDVFRITSTNLFEDKLYWDKSSDPIEFFGLWRGKFGKDARSTFWVKIKAQGTQNAADKMGKIDINVTSFIETKFDYSNYLTKALIEIYSYLYYHNMRRRFIEEQKRLLDVLDVEIKKVLDAMG